MPDYEHFVCRNLARNSTTRTVINDMREIRESRAGEPSVGSSCLFSTDIVNILMRRMDLISRSQTQTTCGI